MKNYDQNKSILLLSLPLVFLLIIASYVGLFVADTYSEETLNWSIQAFGQDAVNLFLISPFLVITSWFVYRKRKIAFFLWGGGILYVFYTSLAIRHSASHIQ